jgi:Uma2 family endonuclease
MSQLLELPPLDESEKASDYTRFNLAVWEQVLADPTLEKLSLRIETNGFGQIVMSPPPHFQHSRRRGEITGLFHEITLAGKTLPECPLSTSDGVKAIDVAWISEDRLRTLPSESILTQAPEICVEVFSPSNSRKEMDQKKALYFEAGAEEVWFCQRDGSLQIFQKENPDTPQKVSRFASNLPDQVA